MRKKRLIEKTVPVIFDVVVWSGFAAFLVATYIACHTLLQRFPEQVNKIIGLLQSFTA
ncbi:hypothetical protein [Maridesulfovibrio sp.]|uniref:hypothetical protein n=1 Tax=Maridesulfovibrio sp. TaxID=2795000 RepID=UPI002A18AFF3|nr:hypothetical protein [Maridesulfovibrio sp.]